MEFNLGVLQDSNTLLSSHYFCQAWRKPVNISKPLIHHCQRRLRRRIIKVWVQWRRMMLEQVLISRVIVMTGNSLRCIALLYLPSLAQNNARDLQEPWEAPLWVLDTLRSSCKEDNRLWTPPDWVQRCKQSSRMELITKQRCRSPLKKLTHQHGIAAWRRSLMEGKRTMRHRGPTLIRTPKGTFHWWVCCCGVKLWLYDASFGV